VTDVSQNTDWEHDSTGEWRARTGTQHEIDTTKLRALDGALYVDEVSQEAGGDPYNQNMPVLPQSTEKFKRRSLDDMRQLSEAIKKARSQR
jgi:hypothetical protein